MKILAIGDIFGRVGRDAVFSYMDKHYGEFDLVIANGENAAHGRGMTRPVYSELKKAGIDGFTMGNHTWGCPDIEQIFRYNDDIIRPANYEGDVPGKGSMILAAKNGKKVGIINVIGRTYMQDVASSPFFSCDREIEKLKDRTDIILVDFHAEATSEKIALGYYLDGRVSAVFGTHTHVQTADNHTMPKGTAYITDIGMTGATVSVLGLDKNTIINRFRDGLPQKFEPATGKARLSGCIFEIDDASNVVTKIERVYEES
jgi:metallophosphoesterase (TIGR00282 family)